MEPTIERPPPPSRPPPRSPAPSRSDPRPRRRVRRRSDGDPDPQTRPFAAAWPAAEPSEAARPFIAWGFGELPATPLCERRHRGRRHEPRGDPHPRHAHHAATFPSCCSAPATASWPTPTRSRPRRSSAGPAASWRTTSGRRHPQAMGGMGPLAEISEHGEVTSTTTALSQGVLRSFAATEDLRPDRKAVINDDLGGFGRVTMDGPRRRRNRNSELATLLTRNPTMDDGDALFPPRTATSPPPRRRSARPRISRPPRDAPADRPRRVSDHVDAAVPVVGPEIETEAEKFLATLTPARDRQREPVQRQAHAAGRAEISGRDWRLFAAPAELAIFEIAHLASAPGPQISSRDGWEILGKEYRCVLDFAWPLTTRGGYRNAGA